jgi:DNA-binding NtrC family response regulator
MRTRSALMQSVFDKVRSVAVTHTTVMLHGETGTGKGVVARLIHRCSQQSDGPFISVHCGSIPDTLVESEMFGHEKGAFTGAMRRKPDKFEIARDGTLFLDEIGTISIAVQVKLLQVLQDRSFQRIGGEEILQSNARVIAATNMNLRRMNESGTFRKDLYYRLNVFPIEIPSLRHRKEDIPLLVDTFLERLNQRYQKTIRSVSAPVMSAFEQYTWPGNIRELENLIERAFILEKTEELTLDSLPQEFFVVCSPNIQNPIDPNRTLAEVRRQTVALIEKNYLAEILTLKYGKIGETALQAGISPRQLHKLMTRYGLRKEDFKRNAKRNHR